MWGAGWSLRTRNDTEGARTLFEQRERARVAERRRWRPRGRIRRWLPAVFTVLLALAALALIVNAAVSSY